MLRLTAWLLAPWRSIGTPSAGVDRIRRVGCTTAMSARLQGAWLLAAVAVLVGCELPWSAQFLEPPVAVRATSVGGIEVLIASCSPVRITRFEVTAPKETIQRANDPRIWQVDFSPPATDLRRLVLGQVPPGGTEQVPWPPAGLSEDPDKIYVVRVVLDDGNYSYESFQKSDLIGGRVLFHDRPVSPETFAEQSGCPRSAIRSG